MKNKRLALLMIMSVIGCFAIILALNAVSLLGFTSAKYLKPNDVRGMAVEHHNILYTLNFQQQNEMIDILNRATSITFEDTSKRKTQVVQSPEITKIVIYRFNAPAIEIIPIAYVSEKEAKNTAASSFNFVFSVPQWDEKNYFEESTPNQFKTLLSTTYDP